MTNQIRGVVTREIGGKRLEFALAANEWCELEAEFGRKTSELMAEFFGTVERSELDMRSLRSFFRAALSYSDKTVTHEDAGAMMQDMGLVEAAKLVAEVILASMPKADEAAPGKAKAPARKARG